MGFLQISTIHVQTSQKGISDIGHRSRPNCLEVQEQTVSRFGDAHDGREGAGKHAEPWSTTTGMHTLLVQQTSFAWILCRHACFLPSWVPDYDKASGRADVRAARMQHPTPQHTQLALHASDLTVPWHGKFFLYFQPEGRGNTIRTPYDPNKLHNTFSKVHLTSLSRQLLRRDCI